MLNPVMMGFMNASCFPGLFLVVPVLAVNMLGDGLRDTLDPRLWQRQEEGALHPMASHAVLHNVPQGSRAPTDGEEMHTAFGRHHPGRPRSVGSLSALKVWSFILVPLQSGKRNPFKGVHDSFLAIFAQPPPV